MEDGSEVDELAIEELEVAGLGISMLDPRLIGFFCLFLILIEFGLGILVEVGRRRDGALRGRGPRRPARGFHLLIYIVRALLLTTKAIQAFGRLAQNLVGLIRPPAAVAVAAPAVAPDAIAPAPLLHSQLSTTQDDLQSQQSTVEEELQSQLSASEEDFLPQQLAPQVELQSAVEQDLQPRLFATQEDLTEVELQSAVEQNIQPRLFATEEDFHPQLFTTEEDFQPQLFATELELQPAVEQDLQPPRIETREELWSPAEEEHHSQQSAIVGRPEAATLFESFILINIWNICSLEQCLRNLIACFKKINHPIQFTTAYSRNGSTSSSSSPWHFEYTYGVASANKSNNDQHHQFKSLLLLDQGGIYLIDQRSLIEFGDMIHKQIGRSGYQQTLYDAFEDNSYVLDSFLCDCLNSAGLSIDTWTCMDGSQFTSESAKRCVMDLKVAAGLLCLMKSVLDAVKCKPFRQDLKDLYFTLCARRPIQNLIEAAHSISKLKWCACDIYQMLVLYEAIHDVLVAFGYPNGTERIFQQMRVNYEGIFDEIKCFICASLNGSPCGITRVGHPVTMFLVHSMELFKNHNSIVEHICVGDVTISLGYLLPKLIRYWVKELKKHSVSYPKGGNYIFILNNLARFFLEINELLQAPMPVAENDRCRILELLETLINKYTLKYLWKCWGPVRNCVELNSRRKPCLSSLNAFTEQFDALCKCQMTWVLETKLKKFLREKIKEYITLYYDIFLIELRKKPILRVRLLFQNQIACRQVKHKTTKQVENIVDELFESEHTE